MIAKRTNAIPARSALAGGCIQPGFVGHHQTAYRDFLVPLPPLAEQRRIVAKVDELMALCDRLEAQLAISETESRRRLEAVLHGALLEKNGGASDSEGKDEREGGLSKRGKRVTGGAAPGTSAE
jgi:hypothetical protein